MIFVDVVYVNLSDVNAMYGKFHYTCSSHTGPAPDGRQRDFQYDCIYCHVPYLSFGAIYIMLMPKGASFLPGFRSWRAGSI